MLALGYGGSNPRPVAPLGGVSSRPSRSGRSSDVRGAVDERREAGSSSLPEWRCRWPSASGTATVSWSTTARLLASRAKARPSGRQRGEACIDTRMCKRLLASCRGMLRVRGPSGARRGVDGVMGYLAERLWVLQSSFGSLVCPGESVRWATEETAAPSGASPDTVLQTLPASADVRRGCSGSPGTHVGLTQLPG